MEDAKYIPVNWIKRKIREASKDGSVSSMVKEQVLVELLLEWAQYCKAKE